MSEKELDSSVNDYVETETPKNYTTQYEWDMAIGLQEQVKNQFMKLKTN